MISRSVIVGVCTFRRPSLRRTLLSLAAQDVPAEVMFRTIVADNDETTSARSLVETVASETGAAVTYLHCPSRNISIARNGLLDEAGRSGADLLAFLDDDEWVGTDWLQQLLAAFDGSGADAVFGPVRGVYADDAPAWMRGGTFHDMQPELDRMGLVRTGHTANVLLSPRAPAFEGRRFHLGFGQSGGEDTEFFAAARSAGAILAPAQLAVAFEEVPADRARSGWLARRRFRMGQTHGQLLGHGASPTRRAALAVLACAKVGACLAMAVPVLHKPERRNRAILRGCLHAGAASSLLGTRAITIYGVEDGASSAETSSQSSDRSSQ